MDTVGTDFYGPIECRVVGHAKLLALVAKDGIHLKLSFSPWHIDGADDYRRHAERCQRRLHACGDRLGVASNVVQPTRNDDSVRHLACQRDCAHSEDTIVAITSVRETRATLPCNNQVPPGNLGGYERPGVPVVTERVSGCP